MKNSKPCRKPFWNNELKEHWLDVSKTERTYLKSHGRDRNRQREIFKNIRGYLIGHTEERSIDITGKN